MEVQSLSKKFTSEYIGLRSLRGHGRALASSRWRPASPRQTDFILIFCCCSRSSHFLILFSYLLQGGNDQKGLHETFFSSWPRLLGIWEETLPGKQTAIVRRTIFPLLPRRWHPPICHEKMAMFKNSRRLDGKTCWQLWASLWLLLSSATTLTSTSSLASPGGDCIANDEAVETKYFYYNEQARTLAWQVPWILDCKHGSSNLPKVKATLSGFGFV